MTNESDKQELHENIVAAANGDGVAWKFIVDAYAHRVFALIRSKCADEDLAEEITQSTFCTIARCCRAKTVPNGSSSTSAICL